jgi:hypothetical protein
MIGVEGLAPALTMLAISSPVLACWSALKVTRFHFHSSDSVRKQKYAVNSMPWYAHWMAVAILSSFAVWSIWCMESGFGILPLMRVLKR